MSPDAIRYAAAHDGVSIAYERMGTGPPLLYARGWITHLELQRRTPALERFFTPLREHREVLRYDTRGNGLSSWDVPLPVTKEALLSDLTTVADMIDEPFDLWATTYAGPPAIEYARSSSRAGAQTHPRWHLPPGTAFPERRPSGTVLRDAVDGASLP
jgi:hypothetical protein